MAELEAQTPSKSTPSQKKIYNVIFWAVISLVFLIGIFFLIRELTLFINLQRVTTKLPSQQQTLEVIHKYPPLPAEQDEVFSYTGTISDFNLDRKTIIIQTIRGEKTVHYTNQATFAKILLPTRDEEEALYAKQAKLDRELGPDAPNLIAQTYQREIQLSIMPRIDIGSEIRVVSSENISGSTEFTATKIILLIKKAGQ